MRVAILLCCLTPLPAATVFAEPAAPPEPTPATPPAVEPSTQPGAADGLPVASREARDQLITAARTRMREDRQKYSADQLKDAEALYQVANKDWRSDSAKAALRAMIEKYPDINRTGCAVLYMGQMSRGDQAEEYFRQAINDYGDCYYGNGVQVGALARLYLAGKCVRESRYDEAKRLLDEIDQQYPDAIDHRGRLLSAHVKALRARMEGKPD